MCGLVAMVGWEAPIDPSALRRAMASLRHRGPDGEGAWIDADGRIALGHTRLAIVDREGGAQPLASEDGSIHAVVNGELYGFEALRRELERRGHRFRTGTDSEIVIHLYEDEGPAALERLRGELAFVLWDARQRLLFAARDRFGIKPLVYARRAGVLHVASHAKALFASGVPAAWDRGAAFQAMSLQYPLPDRTLFEGIRVLPPGHFLIARDGELRLTRYWDLDFPIARDARSDADAIAELAARFEDAVDVRLRGDAPIAFQLSGGLDSSAVVGVASRRRAVDAFTIAFDGEGYDELPIVRETAALHGARLHPIHVSRGDLVDAFPDAVAHGEGLAINGHIAAKLLLSRAIHAAGFKVVLTGEGADEVLAGYPHFRRDRLLEEQAGGVGALAALAAANTASTGVMMPEGESLPLGAVAARLGFVPSWLEAKGTLGLRMRRILADDFLAAFAARDPARDLIDAFDLERLHGRPRVDQSAYLWSKLALEGYILRTLGDGMEMANALEGRLPYLDHTLFEFVRTLPVSLKIRDGVEKYALREATADVLTPTVRRRPKHPFMAPPLRPSIGADDRVEAFFQDTLRGASIAPFFDRAKIVALLDGWDAMAPRERLACEPVLILAASACILHRRLGLGESVA